MIRFGVIGAGRIGKVHAATIAANPKAKLVYVADAFRASAEALAAQTGAEVADAEDVIKSSNVDAILIATPTPSHADLIEAAARAGKAILCEKPVSLSVERINACLDVVEKNKSTLMIGFNRRFDPNFASVEARLRRGDVGEIEIVTITSRDPTPPPADYVKSSGGLFRDMMIHDFDMARFLIGEEFVVVNALGSSLVDKAIGAEGDVDTAAVQMQTASGRIAVITNSRRATYGYDQRVEVHGSAGMLAARNIQATSVELSNANGVSGDPVQYFFLERYAQAYANEINAFIDAIDSGDLSPKPGGLDGLQAQKLAEAATVSWQKGRPVEVE
ncbi:inositol 2-dehydrogenase (plasmid) [Rhizobium leguminosarum]|jgi:myo-inositol 2-dehydrogenase/D-chiro-inositol 1-dehydrogenase|uniref:inositol 2-dehydrogenase n=1 Tax=Rhizobium TaxID=379 RepID=UPI00037BFB35|nr:inositol 2-dehydrogenase [Rhizobium leguminosarum]MBA8832304.1 myo-inositol 2-dehydrogenase/D-chiro-inositol 1-dehydrogenase [Rhizobium leguminosarum]MBY5901916.1 inositol 2-dehydrogenase [Rhizobium leguminosarum]MBY5908956.1 inositol 2-dehydrogenase [Rhizobium leguminosarum]MDH6274925.1 myo-inositol 2-dehydrogenase/D-chiro-inositol 1-dehydrogenase [Rhizobium leguminosarum]MVO92638.1 inositol 2-dehydrogenase [Rhizobium leguminosarum bv. phaseoli]